MTPDTTLQGTLIGIATRSARREPMQEHARLAVSVERGLEGDYKGGKHARRQVTLLCEHDWQAAIAAIDRCALPWLGRRANLLLRDVRLPHGPGSVIQIGAVLLEVTQTTTPCQRMDELADGLRKALAVERRGGVCCRVLRGGEIALGDAVTVIDARPLPVRRLP